jgi:hypothetical protein
MYRVLYSNLETEASPMSPPQYTFLGRNWMVFSTHDNPLIPVPISIGKHQAGTCYRGMKSLRYAWLTGTSKDL